MNKTDVTVILGRTTPYNGYILEEMKPDYQPFVEEFTSFYTFLTWARDVERPLLRDKYLAIVTEELFKDRFDNRINHIRNEEFKHIKLVLRIIPKERMYNIEYPDIEIINLDQKAIEHFGEYIRKDFVDISEEGLKALINRIGLSHQTYILYKQDLRDKLNEEISKNLDKDKKTLLSKEDVWAVIKEKKLPPISQIVTFLIRDGDPKLYYKLCEKYSEPWAYRYIKSMINQAIDLRIKVLNGSMTFIDIRTNAVISQILPVVRDCDIKNLKLMKYCMKKYGNFGVEMYVNMIKDYEGVLKDKRTEYEFDYNTKMKFKDNEHDGDTDENLYWN